MALVALKAKQFTNYSLLLGQDDFARHVSSVVVSPKKGSPVVFKGGTPDATVQDLANQAQTITITYAQDWTATGLALWLLQHEGEEVVCKFKPLQDGPTFTATVLVTSGGVGGQIDSMPTLTATLPVQGDVAYSAAAGA